MKVYLCLFGYISTYAMDKSIHAETGSNYTMQTGLTIIVHHTDLKLMVINSRISE